MTNTQEKLPDTIQKYYLVEVNGRKVVDYANTIEQAVEKWVAYEKVPIIVTPVTWKTEVTDITNKPLDEVQPNE